MESLLDTQLPLETLRYRETLLRHLLKIFFQSGRVISVGWQLKTLFTKRKHFVIQSFVTLFYFQPDILSLITIATIFVNHSYLLLFYVLHRECSFPFFLLSLSRVSNKWGSNLPHHCLCCSHSKRFTKSQGLRSLYDVYSFPYLFFIENC